MEAVGGDLNAYQARRVEAPQLKPRFDPVEGFDSTAEARFDVQNLVREIGLIADHDDLRDKELHEIELEMAEVNAEASDGETDKEGFSEETNKHAVTLVPELPVG